MLKNIKLKAKGKLDNFLYSGFTTRKIKIEGKKQTKVEIKINYLDTHDINEKNIVDITKTENPKVLNYFPTPKLLEGKKHERYYSDLQLGFIAMVTPNNINKVQEIQAYRKLSYRQAYKIYSVKQNHEKQRLTALNYYMSLFNEAQ